MKKVIISSKRQTREHISNPHKENDLKTRMIKSGCVDYRRNSDVIDLGNGYSKIVAKDKSKKFK